MAEYITPEVREAITGGDTSQIDLAIVPATSVSDVQTRAEEFDEVTVKRELPSGVLLISTSTGVAKAFLDSPSIGSASFPNRGEIMS